MSKVSLNDVLEYEESLLRVLSAVGSAFPRSQVGETDVGEEIRQGWVNDFEDHKTSNEELRRLDEHDTRAELEKEKRLLQSLYDLVSGGGPTTTWWGKFLEGELEIVEALLAELDA